MDFEFARATTPEELAAVQRLRYAVYVEEMHRYDGVAGEEEHRFAEPEDEHSVVLYARVGDEVVAATRMTCGDGGFSARQVEQYQMAPFLAEIPAELIGVGERNTVLPAYRGSGVLDQLALYCGDVLGDSLRVVFGCCEPHLLSMYLRMGQRTYAEHNINSPTAGYLIPLVAFVPDVDALRGVGPGHRAPASSRRASRRCSPGAARSAPRRSPRPTSTGARSARRSTTLDAQRPTAFDGFTDDETHRCVERSTIIECAAGDRVLKRGGTARNVFVVLDGTLEVRDAESRIVNVLQTGDTFGEMAFLLETTAFVRRGRRHRRHAGAQPQRGCSPQDDRRGPHRRGEAAPQRVEDALRPAHPRRLEGAD